jgi:hypothetical protein
MPHGRFIWAYGHYTTPNCHNGQWPLIGLPDLAGDLGVAFVALLLHFGWRCVCFIWKANLRRKLKFRLTSVCGGFGFVVVLFVGGSWSG